MPDTYGVWGGWLKIAVLWLLAYGTYYLCWVRYPPRHPPSVRRRIDDDRDRR
jgi:hypothetical protein